MDRQMKKLVNVPEPLGNLGDQVEILSELVTTQPVTALKRLTIFSQSLLPKYKRKFKDGLLDEQEKALLEQDLEEERIIVDNLEEHLRIILEDIDMEFNNNRNMMKTVMVLYHREAKYNFGNRILQLSDLIAGSFQSGLSKDHIRTVLEFANFELRKISKVIGNDY
ncbi:MAG TPA: hypothetical protein VJG90_09310 [Candidatus Nanoarchaeia archaeon]|nr:hypothetical protein [Candidatus Nanoarchaeia archaeon]